MKVQAIVHGESVLCKSSDGREVELTMVNLQGEDVFPNIDLQQALQLIKENADWFSL